MEAMNEPIGVVVGVIADAIGIHPEMLRIFITMAGAIFLAIEFHRKEEDGVPLSAALGWLLTGLSVYLMAEKYVEIQDPVLVVMTALCLPAGIGLAYMELKGGSRSDKTLVWLRGAVAWSVIPYYFVYSVPVLNMAFVEITGTVTIWWLEASGAGSYTLGPMMVDLAQEGHTLTSDWDGNRAILTEPLGEGGFYLPMLDQAGRPVSIGFILSCSALQSMIVFVGAIVALSGVSWRRKARGLFISIPTIFVLNAFRNAGIVWLHVTYPDWRWLGLDIFDFAHSYAAKVASLGAMFVMALALFGLLPELHAHVMRIIESPLRRGSSGS